MKRHAVALLTAGVLSLGGVLSAAQAESISGQAENAASDCAGVSSTGGVSNPLGPLTTIISNGTTGLGETSCENDASALVDEQAGFANGDITALGDDALSTASDPGSVVGPVAGQALSIYASTVALQFSMSTDYTNQQVFLTPVVTIRHGDFANSPDGFTYNNDQHLVWDPKASSGSDGHLDGDCIFTLFQQSKRYRSDFDFWATSEDGSVTPLKGSHLTHLEVGITPNDNTEIIASDPNSENPYGDAGSRTIDATLAGEFSGASASFGISQTWNWSVGYAGGARLSSGEHKAEWDQGHSSDRYAKSVQGVETWKVPVNEAVCWGISGAARWHP